MEEKIPTDRGAAEGRIGFFKDFLNEDVARALLNMMIENAEGVTKREKVKMRGRVIKVKRRTAFFGNPGTSYRYAGFERTATPWGTGAFGTAVDVVRTAVEANTGRTFSYALVNHYEDGDAAIGYHADDEGDLDPTAPIISVSLGATRDMYFRHKTGDLPDIKLALTHGSMVEMRPPLQSRWKHAIPVRKRVKEPRFNLTFRVLK
jgi:alkylated DNA repair dioxygenase AlkB